MSIRQEDATFDKKESFLSPDRESPRERFLFIHNPNNWLMLRVSA
jgi:hypothetical protein